MTEQEKFRQQQEERIAGEMSSKLAFKSQCAGCNNNSPPECKEFKVKPEKYRWNEEECPKRSP